jgi:hypothetical protein
LQIAKVEKANVANCQSLKVPTLHNAKVAKGQSCKVGDLSLVLGMLSQQGMDLVHKASMGIRGCIVGAVWGRWMQSFY